MVKRALIGLAFTIFIVGCEDKSTFGRSFLLQVQAEQAVRDALRSPDDAEFSGLSYDLASGVVCGYVSARNGFGGTTGPRKFVYQRGIAMFAEQFERRDFAVIEVKCIGTLPRDALART